MNRIRKQTNINYHRS